MKKFIKFLFSILFFISSVSSFSQENNVEEILEKSENVYNSKVFGLNITYKMFGTYSSKKPFEFYNGYYYRNNRKLYLKINTTTTLSNLDSNKLLKVYEDQKIIELYNQKENNFGEPTSIFKYLKYFPTQNIVKTDNQYKITLIATEITQLPFGKLELFIDETTFQLKKQILYYLTAVKYKDESGSEKSGNPKLEIEFSNYSAKRDLDIEKLINIDLYLNSANQLKKPYDDYKLVIY